MELLPLVLSAVAALVLAPGLRATLVDGGHTVTNYRGVAIACPLGIIVVAAIALTLGAYGFLVQVDALDPVGFPAPAFVLGVAALGLFDDAYSGASRGWRGHGGAVLKGQFPTGALKALGTLALAATVPATDATGDWLLSVLLLALATNLFNILDLRPGRAVKAFVLVVGAAVVAKGGDLLEAIGAYAGAVLVVGAYDLRERGMLGDTGSNVLGAVAGLALLLALDSTTGLAIAVAVLVLITVYGELRSLNSLIERTPLLRHLDAFGRIHTRA